MERRRGEDRRLALSHYATLRQARFWGNPRLGSSGVRTLVGALRHAEGLEELDLSDTGCSDSGADAVAEALVCWPCLTHLVMRSNRMSDKCIQRLRSAVLDSGCALEV